MEFAVCPACGQSVLDDDAESCPFCGASMSAKAGAKPASAKPTSPATSKSPAKAAPKPTSKAPADDSPFELSDAPAATTTAARQPTKGRTFKVVCPMCETEGYIPSSAAGKDVKCANPKCMVPVFTAPLPEPEPVAPPPPKKSGNLLALGLGTAVLVGGIGGAVWYFASLPADDGVFVKPVDITNIPKTAPPGETPVVEPAIGSQTPAADVPQRPDTTAADVRAIVGEALQASQQASLLTGNQNRSKPYCRRLAAEAFALAGDIPGAKQQLDALANVGTQLPFYQVPAWVEIFRQERAAGNAPGAKAALEQAQVAAEKLPSRGRDQLDIATRLVQGLVVTGQHDAARALIAAHQAADLDGEVSANFLWLASDRSGADIDWLFAKRPVTPRKSPQAAAVAACTVLAGELQPALDYASSWPDEATRAECLAAWAEAVTWKTPEQATASIQPAISKLSPPYLAMVWSRAARVANVKSVPDLAKQMVSRAEQALESAPPPESYVIPELRLLVRERPTINATWAAHASAAAELAIAQLEVTGSLDAAKKSLDSALQFARGLGPALPAVNAMTQTADRLGPAGLRGYLKTELELRTDDAARLAMGEYRRSLSDLEGAAQTRFQLQTTILTRAAQLGLEDHAWTIAARANGESEPASRELFLATELSIWLAERFRKANNTGNERMLVAARTTASLPALSRPVPIIFEEQIAAGQYAAAWKTASSPGVRSDLRDSLVLRAATQLALSGKSLDEIWKLVSPVTDIVLREQALDWVAWMAARRGAAPEVWAQRQKLSSATEIVSLCRGVVAGIQDWRAVASQETETSETAK